MNRRGTKPCRPIDDGTDCRIIVTTLKPNCPKAGIALIDPHAETEFVIGSVPMINEPECSIPHFDRHPHRVQRRFRHLDRIVEKDHQSVAGKTFERAVIAEDQGADLPVVLAQHLHHVFRLGSQCEVAPTPQIAKYDGDVAAMSAPSENLAVFIVKDAFGHRWGEKAFEPADVAFLLPNLLAQRQIEPFAVHRRASR